MSEVMVDREDPAHAVREALGPPFGPTSAAAAIGLGVVSLLITGLLSILLGALSEEGRLSAQGIGLAATTEAVSMAIATGLAGAMLPPHRLKLIGIAAAVALAACDWATLLAHTDAAVMVARAAAGAPEGLLLWLTIGMIARTETPERWAAVLFTALTMAQFAAAAAFAAGVIPRFGADGGYMVLAAVSLAAAPMALWLPNRYPPLSRTADEAGAPPVRGWIALLGTLLFISAIAAVAVYLLPLARQAGLPAATGRTAVSIGLAAQILGGVCAAIAAGRVGYLSAFGGGAVGLFGVYAIYGSTAPAWSFAVAAGLGGFISNFVNPFLVPMTIEADPSRRAAVQSGAVQLLGSALGPLLASRVVVGRDVRGVLWLAASLLLAGLAIFAWLRRTRRRPLA